MAFFEISVGFGVGNEGVGEETLETLSLSMVVMFSLSGFCCTVPLVKIGGVENAFPLCEERGIIPELIIATTAIIVISFHLLMKGISWSSLLLYNYEFCAI
jgi:hypothetical protein